MRRVAVVVMMLSAACGEDENSRQMGTLETNIEGVDADLENLADNLGVVQSELASFESDLGEVQAVAHQRYTDAEAVAAVNAGGVLASSIAHDPTVNGLASDTLQEAVDEVVGRLTTIEGNPYTDALCLAAVANAGYATGPHFSGDYTDLTNTPDLSVYTESDSLAAVATTGSYDDLTNRPLLYTDAECLAAVANAGYVTGAHYTDTDAQDALEPTIAALESRIVTLEAALPVGFRARSNFIFDDFEAGIGPWWTQVNGSTATRAATSCDLLADLDLNGHCGSMGLVFDETEQWDIDVSLSIGSFSLWFHDDATDAAAAAWVGVLSPGGQERIGVLTDTCPNHYYYNTNAGAHSQCTKVMRRTGWHLVEFVRDGVSTRGYLDYELVFETNRPARNGFTKVTVIQEVPGQLLTGFMIDDVRFDTF